MLKGNHFREEVRNQVVDVVNELLDQKLAYLERNQLNMNEKLASLDGRIETMEKRLANLETQSQKQKFRSSYSYKRPEEKYQHIVKPTQTDVQVTLDGQML